LADVCVVERAYNLVRKDAVVSWCGKS